MMRIEIKNQKQLAKSEYPAFYKDKNSNLIVCFTGLKEGFAVRRGYYDEQPLLITESNWEAHNCGGWEKLENGFSITLIQE